MIGRVLGDGLFVAGVIILMSMPFWFDSCVLKGAGFNMGDKYEVCDK